MSLGKEILQEALKFVEDEIDARLDEHKKALSAQQQLTADLDNLLTKQSERNEKLARDIESLIDRVEVEKSRGDAAVAKAQQAEAEVASLEKQVKDHQGRVREAQLAKEKAEKDLEQREAFHNDRYNSLERKLNQSQNEVKALKRKDAANV